jgi:tRNA(fMet)-specific endonuclease VapC
MLDTNIISYIIRDRDFALIDKFESICDEEVLAISSITVAELYYGVKKRKNKRLELAVREFLMPLVILPFDEKAANFYGEIRDYLESRGKIIGAYDLLIAAHAISVDAVLVTNNVREFKRVRKLKIEDWSSNQV